MNQPIPVSPDREPGSVLDGKWRIVRALGIGGMASVYEAQHRNGKRVALKVLHGALLPDRSAVERFQREGHLANAIEHPGVASVLDDGVTEDGAPYLVMEFLEGEDLGRRLNRLRRPLDLPDLLAIAGSTLDVLGTAHEVGIIHRDLKPDNIFLCADGSVKILDFGIAHLIASAQDASGTRTELGVILGTVRFMSREQALGRHEEICAQSDLWSLGATLYFTLSLQHLYGQQSQTQYLARLLQGPPRPLCEVAPEVPEAIGRVIDRALRHEKSERWPSAALMKSALEEAAAEAGIVIPSKPSTAGFAPPPRPPSGRRNLAETPGPGPVAAPATPTPLPPVAPPLLLDRHSQVTVKQITPTDRVLLSSPGGSASSHSQVTVQLRPVARRREQWLALLLGLGLTTALGLALFMALRAPPRPALVAGAAPSATGASVPPGASTSPSASAAPEPAAPSLAASTASSRAQPPAPSTPVIRTPRVVPHHPVDIGNSRQ